MPTSFFHYHFSKDAFVLACLKYLDRFAHCYWDYFPFSSFLSHGATRSSSLRITSHNLYGLALTAFTLVCTTLQRCYSVNDKCFLDDYYAKVWGILTIAKMNRLKSQFSTFAERNIHVAYDSYLTNVLYLQTYLVP